MGKNRDGLNIIVAILNAANPACSKTRIMAQANLSYSLLEKYLTLVTESELIKQDNYKYHLTENGRDFLRRYKQFEEKYSKANQTMETLISEREQLVKTVTKANGIGNSNGVSH